MAALGVKNIDGRGAGERHDPALGRASYIFNPGIAGIDRADAILIIGSDPRHEAAVLNARIRKRWRQGDAKIALIGERVDLTYPYEYLGAGPQTLADVASGAVGFGKTLAAAKRPLVIVGQGALTRADGPEILSLAAKIAGGEGRDEGWNGLAVVHTAAARVGALDLGLVPRDGALDTIGMVAASATKALDVLFLLGADELAMNALGDAFVVYVGSHGDNGAHRADVILPGAAYTEKSGTYVNTEGRVQMARRAGFPPGDAREGLGDPARALRRSRPEAAVRFAVGAARAALCPSSALRPRRRDRAGMAGRAPRARRARRQDDGGAVPQHRRRLLPDQPDRARLRRHGGMLGAGGRSPRVGGGVGDGRLPPLNLDPSPQSGGGGPCEAWWRGAPPPSALRAATSPVSRGRTVS